MEEQGGSLVIVSDDAAMSVGDSEKEGSESNGFSRTDSNSSRGESTHSQANRKRPANESPEPEWDETRRREFPGTVTRSKGRCRVHIPSSIRAGALEVIARLITPTASTTDTVAVADAAGTVSATPAANTTGVTPTADTSDSAGAPCASTRTDMTSEEDAISRVDATSVINVVGDSVQTASIIDEETVILLEPMTVMTQQHCVVRLTRAGLHRGPRTDRDGNSLVELDLDFADRYSMSHKPYDVTQ